MEKGMMLRAGVAVCVCAGLACALGTSYAAPSLARPGADIAHEKPAPEIGIEDRSPNYRQDGDDAQFTIENFIMEAPDLFLDKAELTRILVLPQPRLSCCCGVSAAAGQPRWDCCAARAAGAL